MVPEIFYSVCYDSKQVPPEIAKLHTFHPAVLDGYSRRRRRHSDAPGITEDPGHQVFGTFATGLTDAILVKLDYFEGRGYHRKRVNVKLLANIGNAKGLGNVEGDKRVGEVYVFTDRSNLEDEEWDLEEFHRDRLQAWTQPGYVQGRCDPDLPATVIADN
ncbi:hypothetical protein CHU98_g9048 [Xylaria longipes]|nr:hypothetical protein CHU98_g9048 [Xylaria longipes]